MPHPDAGKEESMRLAVSFLVSVAQSRDERSPSDDGWTAEDLSGRATAYRPPTAEECGITDGQEWIDLCG
jgi:hypothetical protein